MTTHGTLSYDHSQTAWVIEAEPHVSMWVKRVFAQVGKHSMGKHVLSDTPETARNIEWFLTRFPLKVRDERRLADRSREHRETTSLVESILSGNYQPPTFKLALPPRDYQAIAATLWLKRGSLLLADDLGVGKTATSICALSDPRTLPAVVVTPPALALQWLREIERFLPNVVAKIITKGTPYDLMAKRGNPRQPSLVKPFPDVVITSYHKLSGWAETLRPLVRTVIFDEVQELRCRGSEKYNAAVTISRGCSFRIGLSATPIYNYGGEIFNVIDAVEADALGTREEFAREWCGGDADQKALIKDPVAFSAFLRQAGIMLRRTKEEVGRSLPPTQVIPYYLPSDPAALEKVSGTCGELARLILGAGPELRRGDRFRASEEFSVRLRQATGIAKAPSVANFVRMVVESGEKVVLFGHHREVYSIWLSMLSDLNPVMWTGTESPTQKQESLRRFQSGESKVFICALRAGAGLDGLQYADCHVVVFGELDWSAGVHEQCVGRVARDGQPLGVLVYYLLTETGSDPTVADIIGIKKQQIDGIRKAPGQAETVVAIQTDRGHIKRLAEAYLRGK